MANDQLLDTNQLDPEIAARAELACELNTIDALACELLPVADIDAQWLTNLALAALAMGLTLGQALANMLPRVHTGYRPEAQRRALRHVSYSNGLPVVS